MSLDPTGQWGLRQKLHIATSQGYSYETLETLLYVDAATLRAYCTDPTYVLDPTDVALIIDNLFNVEIPSVWYDERKINPNVTITYGESVYWTDEQLDELMWPDDATAFKVHYLSESGKQHPVSTPLYNKGERDPADVSRSVTAGNLQRLICVVYYTYRDVTA
jgi:hypothetical protein